jgi:hypothetical protein
VAGAVVYLRVGDVDAIAEQLDAETAANRHTEHLAVASCAAP